MGSSSAPFQASTKRCTSKSKFLKVGVKAYRDYGTSRGKLALRIMDQSREIGVKHNHHLLEDG